MAREHARHRGSEKGPARLRQLPHARTRAAHRIRRGRPPAGPATHGDLREPEHAAAHPAAPRRAADGDARRRAAARAAGAGRVPERRQSPRPPVVITEYDLPRPTIQPHDVIVDPDGVAWYCNFGEQTLGKLDPKTGRVTEYRVPELKPGFPTGALSVRLDGDSNLWLGMMFQGGIAKFDRKTATFSTWSLPPDVNKDMTQVNMTSPLHWRVDGKVWTNNNGFAAVHRLDLATGKFETWEPFRESAARGRNHNIYDVIADSKNNAYFTDFLNEHIGRIDAKTGVLTLHTIPTPRSAPRRGQMDPQDRLWFGEYRGNKIGMFDTRAERFTEWTAPRPWSQPYDVTLDKNGEAWTGSMLDDRVLRLDPRTGVFIEYLLPRSTNIRRVFVDSSTTPVTFWVGSNHGASVIKLEPLD